MLTIQELRHIVYYARSQQKGDINLTKLDGICCLSDRNNEIIILVESYKRGWKIILKLSWILNFIKQSSRIFCNFPK